MLKGQYCYFAAKSYPETGGMPLDEITRSRGLVRKAQELQSKGCISAQLRCGKRLMHRD
jgi:hypothetical protein